MNTFVPHGRDFARSAADLDNKRLFKQYLECLQLLDSKIPPNRMHHPAAQMWLGYTDALREYTNAIILEYNARNKSGIVLDTLQHVTPAAYPPWLEQLSVLHRAKLKAKQPDHAPYRLYAEEPDNRSRYPVLGLTYSLVDWAEKKADGKWYLDSCSAPFVSAWAAILHVQNGCF